VKPLSQVERAVAYQDTHTLGDVAREIIDGKAQHWRGEKSEIVTEIKSFPLMKVCRVWLAGGDMDELVNVMLPDVEAWAKDNGCARVEIVGRKGWKRALPEYREPYAVLHKELEHG
jgi:hypothetical protein